MSVAAIEIEPTGIEPTGIGADGDRADRRGAEMPFDVRLEHARARRDRRAVRGRERRIRAAAPAVEAGAGSDCSRAEPIRSELQWTLFRSVVTKLTSFSGRPRAAPSPRRSATTFESESAFSGFPANDVPASTSPQVAWSALQVATFVPGAGTSPQSGSCERRSDERPIEPTGRSSRPIEPTGIEPTGIEPTGIEPTGIEPTGIEPTGIEPTGIEPTGIEPTGIEPTGVELVGGVAARGRVRRRAGDEREPGVRDVGELHAS